jgi:hypothetical protein
MVMTSFRFTLKCHDIKFEVKYVGSLKEIDSELVSQLERKGEKWKPGSNLSWSGTLPRMKSKPAVQKPKGVKGMDVE